MSQALDVVSCCNLDYLTFKHLGWYLNFTAWFMKNVFEQKKGKTMK